MIICGEQQTSGCASALLLLEDEVPVVLEDEDSHWVSDDDTPSHWSWPFGIGPTTPSRTARAFVFSADSQPFATDSSGSLRTETAKMPFISNVIQMTTMKDIVDYDVDQNTNEFSNGNGQSVLRVFCWCLVQSFLFDSFLNPLWIELTLSMIENYPSLHWVWQHFSFCSRPSLHPWNNGNFLDGL